jgi:catechol 2,3-dioxygenase-like lactoylglutathione lyase family enzyme
VRIDHINIVVTNLEEAEEYFVNLGFVPKKGSTLEGEWLEKMTGLGQAKAEYLGLELPGQDVKIELLQYLNPVGKKEEDISKPNSIGFRHLAFEVTNIEEIYKKLKNKNVTFLSDVIDNQMGKKLCYFLGPDGIILELAEYQK